MQHATEHGHHGIATKIPSLATIASSMGIAWLREDVELRERACIVQRLNAHWSQEHIGSAAQAEGGCTTGSWVSYASTAELSQLAVEEMESVSLVVLVPS